jgi:hypothetical protein
VTGRPASVRTVLLAPSQPTTYRAATVVPSAAATVTRSSLWSMPQTSTSRRTSTPSARARRSSSCSSAGWLNIDDAGQPEGPSPGEPKRSSVVPDALRHS